MGLSLDGECYLDGAAAVEGLVQSFPMLSVDAVVDLTTYSLSGDVVTFTTIRRSFVDGKTDTKTQSLTLLSCPDPDTGPLTLSDVFGVPSVEEGAAAWAAGFVLPFAIALLVWGIRQVFDVVTPH